MTFLEINLGLSRCFLLPCQDGYLLIDTSMAASKAAFLKALQGLNVTVPQIRWLLITHHHLDHVGFAEEILKESGARLIIHRAGVEQLKSGVMAPHRPVNRRMRLLSAMISAGGRERLPALGGRAEDVVIEGDDDHLLASIGIEGRILHTPGHTRDSISVLLADGHAFVGDAASNSLHVLGTAYRPFVLENPEQVKESWVKLKQAGARVFHPAHGAAFEVEKLKI
ncbi:MAG TPA: MBL fold metallo-hydrolase [Anaerolineaceae bacterium]|nr:MBL fold metallo-hydrolase [Anaerolineaceae bacterium]HPN50539.1 MBL fold metallo-hydrolase [Anaerolineaceae bacterium]